MSEQRSQEMGRAVWLTFAGVTVMGVAILAALVIVVLPGYDLDFGVWVFWFGIGLVAFLIGGVAWLLQRVSSR